LMKTGRPEYYIPSRMTVSRDVKCIFKKTPKYLLKRYTIQDHKGALSFVTDMWTSPNHKAYMGNTVTFEHNGSLITLVLDVIEVAKVIRL
ncbi:hypothetical protein FISHEDRAFT_16944, partial [Fistulina hepatica ATCC 64428]